LFFIQFCAIKKAVSKRRTRLQKIKAQKKIKLAPELLQNSNKTSEAESVKSDFPNSEKIKLETKTISNNPVDTEQSLNLKLIREDITKSLITSSLMLCLIVVIYLLWYKY